MDARHLLISFMIFIFMSVGSIARADDCSRAGDLYNQAVGEGNHLGHTDQTIAYYRKALTINPNFALAHFSLGDHPINE